MSIQRPNVLLLLGALQRLGAGVTSAQVLVNSCVLLGSLLLKLFYLLFDGGILFQMLSQQLFVPLGLHLQLSDLPSLLKQFLLVCLIDLFLLLQPLLILI